MEMEVDVSISLDGKRITGNVQVEQKGWEADPFHAVLNALQNEYNLELSRFYEDRKVRVDYGETIGRFDMDMTETLDEETIRPAMTWMAIDISKSGEVTISNDDYFIKMLNGLMDVFPFLKGRGSCHICSEDEYYHDCEMSMDSLIIHFNDHHEWTINKIADWLETLDADIQMKVAASAQGELL